MSAKKSEKWDLASLDELLAIARAMEREAIDEYAALSRRMVEMARPDLARVFDTLVLEEMGHLDKVNRLRAASRRPQPPIAVSAPPELFDDEGAGLVAPELLTAYRAFSMAVRNEERAFTFWTYVAAHAQSADVKSAAERMAREELGHVATLRHERRTAFHSEGAWTRGVVGNDLKSLEDRLSRLLDDMAAQTGDNGAEELRALAGQARARAESLGKHPFDVASRRNDVAKPAVVKAGPLSEYLLDRYLEIGDRAKSERDTAQARSFAAELIACIRAVRGAAT